MAVGEPELQGGDGGLSQAGPAHLVRAPAWLPSPGHKVPEASAAVVPQGSDPVVREEAGGTSGPWRLRPPRQQHTSSCSERWAVPQAPGEAALLGSGHTCTWKKPAF